MSLTVNLSEIEADLAKILLRIEDPLPFFEHIGEIEKRRVRERIMHTKVDPDGVAWVGWAPYTYDQRHLKGNIAQGLEWDSGDLLNSVRYAIDGAFGIDIGTDVWYAPLQQDGAGKIPKREIFGWEDALIPQMAQAFVRHLEGVAP